MLLVDTTYDLRTKAKGNSRLADKNILPRESRLSSCVMRTMLVRDVSSLREFANREPPLCAHAIHLLLHDR
jgi:hypothetical protein